MVLTGHYEHQIDSKLRLAIPSELRRQLQRALGTAEGESIALYASLSDRPGVVCLYTEPMLDQRARELDQSSMDPDELEAYVEAFFSMVRSCELDKQGRVRLPTDLLEQAGLPANGKLAVLGVRDHIQLRDAGAWKKHLAELRTKRPELLMNPRKAMRAKPNTPDAG
ncbi:MAG: hypothetical protein AAF288_11815 [Planctomycetota bacterium]